MSYSTWERIAETPWWVYLFLLGIFYLAYLATKPRILSARTAILFPFINHSLLVFLCFFFITFNLQNILILLCTTCLGIVLGFTQYYFSKVKAVNPSQIYVPGSWLFIIFLFLAFFAKYYFPHPDIFAGMSLSAFKESVFPAIFAGSLTGLFIGRTSYLIKCLTAARSPR